MVWGRGLGYIPGSLFLLTGGDLAQGDGIFWQKIFK